MQEHQPNVTMQIRANPAAVADPGKVRIGGESPSSAPCAKHDLYAPLSRRPHSAAWPARCCSPQRRRIRHRYFVFG